MELRPVLSALIAGTASLGLGAPAVAQSPVIDEGVLVLSRGGAPTRSETFRIVRNLDRSITAFGKLSNGNKHMTSELATDSLGTPILYKFDVVDGGAKVIELRAMARGGRLSSLRSNKATGDEAMRDYPLTSGRALIADATFLHHLYFAALGKAPGAVQVIAPHSLHSVTGTLLARGLEPVNVAGKSVTATHYSLVAGSARYEFWVDSQGRLLRVVAPDGLIATREELPK
jgi:hypothetical protein